MTGHWGNSDHRIPFGIIGQLTSDDVDGIEAAYALAPVDYDALEIGTCYGGSAYLGASWAKRHNRRLWCMDNFGRPSATPGVFDEWRQEGLPSMEIAFAALRSEDLHRWTALVPGNTLEVGFMFADRSFGLVFIDGGHNLEWGLRDGAFAERVVVPGGIIAYHDYTEDQYPGLVAAINRRRDEGGWGLVAHHGAVVVFKKPE